MPFEVLRSELLEESIFFLTTITGSDLPLDEIEELLELLETFFGIENSMSSFVILFKILLSELLEVSTSDSTTITGSGLLLDELEELLELLETIFGIENSMSSFGMLFDVLLSELLEDSATFFSTTITGSGLLLDELEELLELLETIFGRENSMSSFGMLFEVLLSELLEESTSFSTTITGSGLLLDELEELLELFETIFGRDILMSSFRMLFAVLLSELLEESTSFSTTITGSGVVLDELDELLELLETIFGIDNSMSSFGMLFEVLLSELLEESTSFSTTIAGSGLLLDELEELLELFETIFGRENSMSSSGMLFDVLPSELLEDSATFFLTTITGSGLLLDELEELLELLKTIFGRENSMSSFGMLFEVLFSELLEESTSFSTTITGSGLLLDELEQLLELLETILGIKNSIFSFGMLFDGLLSELLEVSTSFSTTITGSCLLLDELEELLELLETIFGRENSMSSFGMLFDILLSELLEESIFFSTTTAGSDLPLDEIEELLELLETIFRIENSMFSFAMLFDILLSELLEESTSFSKTITGSGLLLDELEELLELLKTIFGRENSMSSFGMLFEVLFSELLEESTSFSTTITGSGLLLDELEQLLELLETILGIKNSIFSFGMLFDGLLSELLEVSTSFSTTITGSCLLLDELEELLELLETIFGRENSMSSFGMLFDILLSELLEESIFFSTTTAGSDLPLDEIEELLELLETIFRIENSMFSFAMLFDILLSELLEESTSFSKTITGSGLLMNELEELLEVLEIIFRIENSMSSFGMLFDMMLSELLEDSATLFSTTITGSGLLLDKLDKELGLLETIFRRDDSTSSFGMLKELLGSA